MDLARKLEYAEGTALLEHPEQVIRDYRASRFAWNASQEPIEWIDLSDVPKKRQSEVTAASHVQMKRIQALLKEDPRLIFAVSSDDELAIEACAHVGNALIMQLHLDHGAPLSLPTAVSMGNLEAMQWMLDQDEQLIFERGAHDFPLMWYVVMGTGSPEVAACLHSYGVDLDQESVGTTLLHHSVRRGRTELVEWLIENGASPEALSYSWDENGQTPLQLARIHEQAAVIQLLKAAGAPG